MKDTPWGSHPVLVYFPKSKMPSYFFNEVIALNLVNGYVVQLKFQTRGEAVKNEVIALLREKFGKPTELHEGLGWATWDFADFQVTHRKNDAEMGTVNIEYRKYAEVVDKWQAARKTSKIPEPSLFAISLGKPLAVDECPRGKSGQYDHASPGQKAICAERELAKDSEWGASLINLYFPANNIPNYLETGTFTVTLLNGNVEEVEMFTKGIPVQDIVLKT